jgi:predicted glycoside hydrolase/deacetylase ChbG (UPF0249 family)
MSDLSRLCALKQTLLPGPIAADLGLQFHQVGEDIGMAPQFVGNHFHCRDHSNVDAPALHGFDRRAEIAVAGKQHQLIDMV